MNGAGDFRWRIRLYPTKRHRGAGISVGTGCGSRRAFTVIELLVVIAIIALLAALLLPALSRAKAAGQASRCKSNLHQLGLGLRVYLDANGSAYPLDFAAANNAKKGLFWFDDLAATLPSAKWGEGVFKCPAYNWSVFEGQGEPNGYALAGGS